MAFELVFVAQVQRDVGTLCFKVCLCSKETTDDFQETRKTLRDRQSMGNYANKSVKYCINYASRDRLYQCADDDGECRMCRWIGPPLPVYTR